MKLIDSTPRQDGFRMPAEFEAHRGTWILWPERLDNWRMNAKPAQQTFASLAIAISQFEKVTVGATSAQIAEARLMLPPHINVVDVSYDDAWVRDTGPVCVVNDKGDVRGIDWEFNSWGGKEGIFPSWEQDNLVAQQVLKFEGLDWYKSNMVLEGGAILVDGEGTLLTTEECLLNPNRNPGKSKEDVENILKEYLNVEKIIWLKRGIYLDEAGGHIDNLCCFIRPGVVALTWTDDKSDPQHEISVEAFELLQNMTDAKGRSLEIYKIHQPAPMHITQEESKGLKPIEGSVVRSEGDRLPASYINFYIVNGGVIIPLFNDPQDLNAYQTLQRLFSNRKVIGVASRELLLGGGAIHCIVQQIPHG
jgi:agmatine deiminase